MKIKELKEEIGDDMYQFFKANFEDYIEFTYRQSPFSPTKLWVREGPKSFIKKDYWSNHPKEIVKFITEWYNQHETVKADRKIHQDRLRALGTPIKLCSAINERLKDASIRAEEFKNGILLKQNSNNSFSIKPSEILNTLRRNKLEINHIEETTMGIQEGRNLYQLVGGELILLLELANKKTFRKTITKFNGIDIKTERQTFYKEIEEVIGKTIDFNFIVKGVLDKYSANSYRTVIIS